jgi:catechol 2,3-dioxygenase
MGATTNEIFGQRPAAEPAVPGSYGEPPRGFRLPEATRLGPVRLQVASLARSLSFYEGTLGLHVVERDAARAVLAAHGSDTPLVELHEHAGARPMAQRGRLGLYHFAILLPDRPSLGRFVRHLGQIGARAGAGDHLVSEAFYLQDPDGLGIEVYADRPRDTWRRMGRELMIATDPVDLPGLVQAAGDAPWTEMPAGTVIGHVHLHVGDLARGAAFYADAVGFDRMTWRYPGALFLGAGGYHHHLATNPWAGSGAQPAAADDARLLEWTIELPDAASLDAAARSLEEAGSPVRREGDGVVTRDPWGTGLRLRVARATR